MSPSGDVNNTSPTKVPGHLCILGTRCKAAKHEQSLVAPESTASHAPLKSVSGQQKRCQGFMSWLYILELLSSVHGLLLLQHVPA